MGQMTSVPRAPSSASIRDQNDAARWRYLDAIASDPEFKLDINAGGWQLLKALIETQLPIDGSEVIAGA